METNQAFTTINDVQPAAKVKIEKTEVQMFVEELKTIDVDDSKSSPSPASEQK